MVGVVQIREDDREVAGCAAAGVGDVEGCGLHRVDKQAVVRKSPLVEWVLPPHASSQHAFPVVFSGDARIIYREPIL